MLEPSTTSFRDNGWITLPGRIPSSQVSALKRELLKACDFCWQMQVERGLSSVTPGTAHHLLSLGDSFVELLADFPIWDELHSYFGGPFILNSFGGVVNRSGESAYVHAPHRDVRWFTGEFPLMANMLIMLDPFTVENGATYMLTGSHRVPDKPDNDQFFRQAERAVGPAGSIVVWNSNLWHATGVNKTSSERCALTLTFTPPFVKPQIDHVRQLGQDRIEGMPERLKQLLGYFSRIPSNHDEWYQPREKRFSRQ